MKISIAQATKLLLEDDVVAIPTETVYGLAGSLYSEKAIKKIFSLKNRPSDNPLIVHVPNIQTLQKFVHNFPPHFEKLASTFWPGSLTLILPAENIPKAATAGLPTAAFRIPSHPITQEILALAGPLVIPSANLSGKPSSTSYEHVEKDFGSSFPVVDGGVCEKGIESTILIFKDDKWQIGRLGAISPESLYPILHYVPEDATVSKAPICPGQLYRHYAPAATLHLSNNFANASLIIGFLDRTYPATAEVWHMGSSSNPEQAAHELYHLLRELDRQNKSEAWIDMDFPETGLWKTIRERLSKAAHP